MEIMKRISRNQNIILWVISSKPHCDSYRKNGVRSHYVIVPNFIKYEKFFTAKIINSIVGSIFVCIMPIRVQNDNILIHSPSDFLWDTLPAFIKKSWNKEIKWFASVYHFIPRPSERPGGFNPSNLLSFIAQRLSLPLITRWSDMIQTETTFVKDELVRRYQVSPEKIIVCQSGVNPQLIDSFSWSKGKIYDACFLARLHKSKGIYDLIEAWANVCKCNKDAKLAVAGSGSVEMIREVRDKINNLNLENNISFLGFLSEENKYKLLKASKLYVLPSYEEGIPITFFEAMYCGLPVVTYFLPAYSDIRDYIMSVPLGDAHSLADEILRVLEDDDLIRVLGEQGRRLAKEQTWEKVAEFTLSQILKIGM